MLSQVYSAIVAVMQCSQLPTAVMTTAHDSIFGSRCQLADTKSLHHGGRVSGPAAPACAVNSNVLQQRCIAWLPRSPPKDTIMSEAPQGPGLTASCGTQLPGFNPGLLNG